MVFDRKKGKAGPLSRLNSPGRPGNSRPLRVRAAQISCAYAAKNTMLPPPPHRSIRPTHVTESLDFLKHLRLAPMLLPVHQPYIALKYHGCSNCRKYTQKRLLELKTVRDKKFPNNIASRLLINS